MYHERSEYYRPHDETPFDETGTGRHRASDESFAQTLVPPDPGWDPAEELAFMLQDAREQEDDAAFEEVPAATAAAPGTPLGNLHDITAELPPLREAPKSHRKVRREMSRLRATSLLIAALAAVVACSVSLFGGVVAYEPLRLATESRPEGAVASWWPLLIYGPWLVASLSVLRAALHRRRAVHSWVVVLLFSSIAMLLCILHAPRTVSDTAAAALPGLASLVCFQQLVRQVTLTRPPRRTTTPRHRLNLPSAQAPSDDEQSGATTRRAPLPFPHQRHHTDDGRLDTDRPRRPD
ncbi:DUF2637 domain-containing protein [Streptomyces minutiscleroticus]|uniref:Integral membrane protein n=1 Tax=Streptomyces minutiscleroticus TaxID=68238 RepID=A0A918NCV2_9ACTN|nr:DUF2637 domain-containing protein [Streptomyces minutiscleroticus]GGX58871.1 hypothetical protein GCM10010358_11270 [Streptomyces minutiscleroticus]